jgi:hypothetical protein
MGVRYGLSAPWKNKLRVFQDQVLKKIFGSKNEKVTKE